MEFKNKTEEKEKNIALNNNLFEQIPQIID